MLKQNKDMLKMCSCIIMSMIITTRVNDKDKLIVIAKSMRDAAANSDEYSQSMKDAYSYACKFLENLWTTDFKKIISICLSEKNK